MEEIARRRKWGFKLVYKFKFYNIILSKLISLSLSLSLSQPATWDSSTSSYRDLIFPLHTLRSNALLVILHWAASKQGPAALPEMHVKKWWALCVECQWFFLGRKHSNTRACILRGGGGIVNEYVCEFYKSSFCMTVSNWNLGSVLLHTTSDND